jgi:hypothetical protein
MRPKEDITSSYDLVFCSPVGAVRHDLRFQSLQHPAEPEGHPRL